MTATWRERRPHPTTRRGGFTLIELIVVVLIILLLTAAAIPVIMPSIRSSRINLAARTLQAQFANARERALKADAPRGFRMLPDPVFGGPTAAEPNRPLAFNRSIELEAAPDYKEGLLIPATIDSLFYSGWSTPAPNVAGAVVRPPHPPGVMSAYYADPAVLPQFHGWMAGARLMVVEQQYRLVGAAPGVLIPNPPTNWFRNIRQGDKLRILATGRTYTIVGPCPATILGQPNTERLIDFPADPRYALYPNLQGAPALDTRRPPEFLWLLNGVDDNGNGLIDESRDELDNDSNTLGFPIRTDPGYNGVDDDNPPDGAIDELDELVGLGAGEFELEADPGGPSLGLTGAATAGYEYLIIRRPIPAVGSSEVAFPGDVLIDATGEPRAGYGFTDGTAPGTGYRSRLPISNQGYCDVLVAPNGQLVRAEAGASNAPDPFLPFYHFWLAEREDIYDWDGTPGGIPLPITRDAYQLLGLDAGERVLNSERRLVTITARTGQIVANSPERFTTPDSSGAPQYDREAPYYDAQRGARDVK